MRPAKLAPETRTLPDCVANPKVLPFRWVFEAKLIDVFFKLYSVHLYTIYNIRRRNANLAPRS